MFQATRRRLALWYMAVTAVLLLVFASGVAYYVRATLVDRIDDTLHHVVEVVERSLVLERDPQGVLQLDVGTTFRNRDPGSDDDRIDLEWFDPSGQLRWSTLNEGAGRSLQFSRKPETLTLPPDRFGAERPVRQLTERLEVDGAVLGYLRVSHPWFEVTKPTQEFLVDLGFGSLAMLLAVGVSGWLLSGLAMRPVRDSYQQLRQFTADASHELRNPVALIQTNVQAALSDPDSTVQEQRQQLEVIERLTRRLGRLVDDLLFLARQDSGILQPRREPVEVDALVLEVVEEQQLQARERGVELGLDFEQVPDPCTVVGDRDQLARLCTNLIANALQYTPAGGHVTVELAASGDRLHLRVSDTGIGIPEAALPQLFERFYRVDPARSHSGQRGSGLGLAIVATILESHQGQIAVRSREGQGSCFDISLPLPTE